EFGANYNPEEQGRVLREIQNLIINAERAWPAMLASIDDKRYCITLGNSRTASNFTIGKICEAVLHGTLTAAYLPHIPEEESAYFALRNPPQRLQVGGIARWCKERQAKGAQLTDLQIDMCRWAIDKIASLDVTIASKNQKDEATRKIQAQIELLTSSKK